MSERIAQAFSKIQEKIETFINNGSRWTLQNIEHIELKVAVSNNHCYPAVTFDFPNTLKTKKPY